MNRRSLIKYGVGGAALLAGTGAAGYIALDRKFNPKTPLDYPFPDIDASPTSLDATPSCGAEDGITPSLTEGPFYTPKTPKRQILHDASTIGEPMILEGRVVDVNCRPIAGAVLDIWSCDGAGVYDNEGFNLRGHQYTDNDGRFHVETVKPLYYKAGPFNIRTPHIHVKVQGPNTALLTTQLFFPGEKKNAQDSIFDDALIMKMEQTPTGTTPKARYNFVLE